MGGRFFQSLFFKLEESAFQFFLWKGCTKILSAPAFLASTMPLGSNLGVIKNIPGSSLRS